jgi:hypothetical protein
MNAFLTSIGERTTEIAAWQLTRLGFTVTLLGEREPWGEKYRRFLEAAEGPVLRVDADVIVNKALADYCATFETYPLEDMTQFRTYDFYRNGIGITCPVLYSGKAVAYLREKAASLSPTRPETSAWRLLEQAGYTTYTADLVAGFHGFYQDPAGVRRAKANKLERGQLGEYDFLLADKFLYL